MEQQQGWGQWRRRHRQETRKVVMLRGRVWFGSGVVGKPPATLEERPAGSEGMGLSCRGAGYTEEELSKGPEAQWVPKNGLAPEEVLRNPGRYF